MAGQGHTNPGAGVLTEGSVLWNHLVEIGGVQEDGWDSDLADGIRGRLDLPSGQPISAELRLRHIDAGTLLRAFLGASQAYVDMWCDLLAMLQEAGATATDEVVEISYHFGDGKDPDVRFDLDHFRRARELMIVSEFDLRDLGEDSVWELPQALPGTGDHAESIADWLADIWAGGDWPEALPPPPPPVPSAAGQALIDEAWALAGFVLAETSGISRGRNEMRDLAEAAERTDRTEAGTPIRILFLMANDMWLGSVVNGCYRLALARNEGLETPEKQLSGFERALSRYRNHDDQLRRLTSQALDLLALPLWKYRYELFSNWVCTQVLDALRDQGPRVHSAGGAIHFRATGTHLATFEHFDPRLHLWTELQTPLDAPRGAGRTASIRPDISLVQDPVTDPTSSPVVVECKQYKKAANADFADVLADYANGRPEALVLLADHGPVREATVFKHLGDDDALVDRLQVVAHLRPDNPKARSELVEAIRQRLGLSPQAVDSNHVRDVAEVQLGWQDPNTDLDLHVFVECPGAEPVEVSWRHPGSPDSPPYVHLVRDVRTGGEDREIVGIRQWTAGATYRVEVRSYRGLGISEAEGAVVTRPSSHLVIHPNPGDVTDRWEVTTLTAPHEADDA